MIVAFPPDGTLKMGGEGPKNCTPTPEGMFEVEMLTFPANPLMLRAITPKLRVEFWAVVIELGEVNRLKSPEDPVAISSEPTVLWKREPAVPVTVKLYEPSAVVLFVRICNTDTAVALVASETLDGERMKMGPPDTVGVIDPVIEMVPLKPPILVRVTLTRPSDPRVMVREFGLDVILKSGTATWDIVSVNVAVWVKNPPANGAVPEIMTEYVPGTALVPTFTNTTATAWVPGESVTWPGPIPIPTSIGILRAEIVICPANPFRLVKVASEVREEPVATVMELGNKDTLKLGWGIMMMTSIEWLRFELCAVTVTVKLSRGVVAAVETTKVELAFPPDFSLTSAGFKLRLTPSDPLISGAMVADILTDPENPFKLTRLNGVEALDPGWTVRKLSAAEILKSLRDEWEALGEVTALASPPTLALTTRLATRRQLITTKSLSRFK
jgi:hypothetical protein